MANTVAPGTYPNVRGVSFKVPYPGVTDSTREVTRFILRKAWNTSVTTPRAIGTFRLVNNAGDRLSRVNDPNAAGCNPNYVYDGSDYTKFRRQAAVNKGYSSLGTNSHADYSAGGANNGAFTFINRVR